MEYKIGDKVGTKYFVCSPINLIACRIEDNTFKDPRLDDPSKLTCVEKRLVFRLN